MICRQASNPLLIVCFTQAIDTLWHLIAFQVHQHASRLRHPCPFCMQSPHKAVLYQQ